MPPITSQVPRKISHLESSLISCSAAQFSHTLDTRNIHILTPIFLFHILICLFTLFMLLSAFFFWFIKLYACIHTNRFIVFCFFLPPFYVNNNKKLLTFLVTCTVIYLSFLILKCINLCRNKKDESDERIT